MNKGHMEKRLACVYNTAVSTKDSQKQEKIIHRSIVWHVEFNKTHGSSWRRLRLRLFPHTHPVATDPRPGRQCFSRLQSSKYPLWCGPRSCKDLGTWRHVAHLSKIFMSWAVDFAISSLHRDKKILNRYSLIYAYECMDIDRYPSLKLCSNHTYSGEYTYHTESYICTIYLCTLIH